MKPVVYTHVFVEAGNGMPVIGDICREESGEFFKIVERSRLQTDKQNNYRCIVAEPALAVDDDDFTDREYEEMYVLDAI